MDFDPAAVERWALDYLGRLSEGGRRGVILGGSIARGQQWAHSDLEAGLLVESRDPGIPYFNVDSGRGVEVIQLVSGEVSEELRQLAKGDIEVVAQWPIQLYRARVISDPNGLLGRFTAQFDQHLFSPRVMRLKVERHASAANDALAQARKWMASGRPRSALCEVRMAMNEAILALHWSLGELPRSQSRMDSRLRDLTSRHGREDFYQLYRSVFGLDTADAAIADSWPAVKGEVFEIAKLWGARQFFETAVDGNFSWGENGGIISVHRLYIPVMGRPGAGIFNKLDDRDWAEANVRLLRFLGLAATDSRVVELLTGRVQDALRSMRAQPLDLDIPGGARHA